jgi:hypothetical protein
VIGPTLGKSSFQKLENQMNKFLAVLALSALCACDGAGKGKTDTTVIKTDTTSRHNGGRTTCPSTQVQVQEPVCDSTGR